MSDPTPPPADDRAMKLLNELAAEAPDNDDLEVEPLSMEQLEALAREDDDPDPSIGVTPPADVAQADLEAIQRVMASTRMLSGELSDPGTELLSALYCAEGAVGRIALTLAALQSRVAAVERECAELRKRLTEATFPDPHPDHATPECVDCGRRPVEAPTRQCHDCLAWDHAAESVRLAEVAKTDAAQAQVAALTEAAREFVTHHDALYKANDEYDSVPADDKSFDAWMDKCDDAKAGIEAAKEKCRAALAPPPASDPKEPDHE